MIAIIDYGVGNLNSIQKALEKLGHECIITNDKEEIHSADGIILPGVGAFNDAIKSLKKSGLVEDIIKAVDSGKPILGICLGMQLLYEKSFEDGEWEGLGILKGNVVKFKDDLKVPHMGWNNIKFKRKDPILKYIKEDDFIYFVHSYYVDTLDDAIAYAEYGVDVPAIVGNKNVYGMQFHPEKSGGAGLNLLKAFGELII
jgi:imidazole glycerol-phosphate synthase subunit HisH